MNAFAERFVRSIRQECLDWFIIFSEKQLRNIIKQYMEYFNKFRPHQGLGSIPEGKPPDKTGKIQKQPILWGLHNTYNRVS
jgi:transposase InsO family protein